MSTAHESDAHPNPPTLSAYCPSLSPDTTHLPECKPRKKTMLSFLSLPNPQQLAPKNTTVLNTTYLLSGCIFPEGGLEI